MERVTIFKTLAASVALGATLGFTLTVLYHKKCKKNNEI